MAPSSVAQLYETFKSYRLGDDFTGCEHCVTEESSAKLAAIPLRDLTALDLNRFAFKTMSTWGTVRHFKHFLPRLLELLLCEFGVFDFPEVLIQKLNYAKWDQWPDSERVAVAQFLNYLVIHHLQEPPKFDGDDRIAVILHSCLLTTKTITPFLKILIDQDNASSAHHLREMINDMAEDIMAGKRHDFNLTISDEFVNWLVSNDVMSYLRQFEAELVAKTPWLFHQLEGVRAAISSRG